MKVEELKNKLNEINELLTQIPEEASCSAFNSYYNKYDDYKGNDSKNEVIGVKHSFSINVTFTEKFPVITEETKEGEEWRSLLFYQY